MIIRYGEWLPDQPSFGNMCISATNVFPVATGYGPFPALSVSMDDALPATPVGWISFRAVTGTRYTFAGTSTNLYQQNGEGWDLVSKSGGYSSSDRWRFALYGGRLVATNGVDNPQAFDLSTDTLFADLPNAPIHKFPMVVRDVLVALDVEDGSAYQVKWSAVNDSEDWTAASGGGSQPIPDGGPVYGGIGGEYGIILQEFGIIRMNFVGGDLRFTFDKIEGAVGCIDAASIVQVGGLIFYLSGDGFYVFDGVSSRNISEGKVSNHFWDALSATESRVTDAAADVRVTDSGEVRVISTVGIIEGAFDPKHASVVWKYPTSTGSKLIMYNFQLDRWSESNAVVAGLHTSANRDGLVLAGFNSTNYFGTFEGTAASALLSTGDLELIPGRSVFVRSCRGIVDAAHTITVGKKTAMLDTEATTSGTSNSNGKVSLRSHGRYHRFQLVPTAAFTEAIGVDVDLTGAGQRV